MIVRNHVHVPCAVFSVCITFIGAKAIATTRFAYIRYDIMSDYMICMFKEGERETATEVVKLHMVTD